MTRCPHCQSPLPEEGMVFCGGCGRRVEGWSKAPAAGEPQPLESLPDGAAPTRKGEVDSALRRVLKVRLDGKAPAADDAGRDAPAGGATERLVPPSSAAETQKMSPPPRPTTAERSASSLSSEMEAIAARGPRLVQITALALFVGLGAAGLAFATARLFRKPIEHRPVVMSLETPSPSVAQAPSLGGGPLVPGSRSRRRGKSGPSAAGAPSPALAPAATGSPPPAAAKAGAAPAAAPPPVAPTVDDSPPAAAPGASAAPAPAPPRHDAPAAAPPVSAMPIDDGETAPPTEQELAEEQQAAQFAEGIRFVARSHRALVENCYERAFKTEPASPGGRVEIAFTIDKEGRATKIATLTNSTGNPRVAQCIEQLISAWQFPRPPSGEFAASYPFVFSGG